MRLTNKHGLPESIIRAMTRKGERDPTASYSATELIAPVRIVILKRRHFDELEEDAMQRFWALVGDGIHNVLHGGEPDNSLAEEKMFCRVGVNDMISGTADLYEGTGILHDWKTTSAWSAIYGSRDKAYEEQLNIYAEIYDANGFAVNELQVTVFYRDWMESKARYDCNYPQMPIEIKRIKLWTREERQEFILYAFTRLQQAESVSDNALPPCSPDEMWQKETKYAVTKKGRKSALRVLDSIDAAEKYKDENGGDEIVVRLGGRIRCERYCSVNVFCSQYQENQEEKN